MAVSAPATREALPPHNLEAEASVLGSILLAEQALDGILIEVNLRPDDFYRPRHRLIFRAMIRLKDKTTPEPVDPLTVCDELKRSGDLEEAGDEDYVHSLPTSVPAAAHARQYARIVKDHAVMRRLLGATQEIQESVFGFRGDARELVEQAERAMFEVAHDDRAGDIRSIEEILHEELDKLEQLSKRGVSLTGTPSGFMDIDDLTGGFQPGNLVVIAARPSMGKSALVTNIAENAAVEHGQPVVIFSLEMSETELAQRFIASQARLSGDDLRKGKIKPEKWPQVVRATDKLASAPLFVDDSSDLGIYELRAKARRLHAKHGIGLVIVDYLQLMRAEDSRDSRVEQVGQMSRGLKMLARELQVPVIGVSQLSRAVEARNPPKPLLSDLRESGQIEQDADLVMFIYRDEQYTREETQRPNEADIIVAKHRNGPVGEVTLTFQSRYPKFSNFVQESVVTGNGRG